MGGHQHVDRRWRFPVFEEPPVPGAPSAWAEAVVAVARDLRCCHRRGAVGWDEVCWELAIHPQGVFLAWDPAPPGIDRPGGEPDETGASRWVLGRGLAPRLPAVEATMWVADTVQATLLRQLRMPWPCRDEATVWVPRIRDSHPCWVDPATGRTVAAVGDLAAVGADIQ
ncbi:MULTISPECIES: hypothetical protein [unclassified Rhodococcus (in: high G+C Gram-positive bacteria)]|uniref:hypothetical protein n=1 Tax=unclassified Rhodococcus (in: high G+C Gram-positive bacteria) TaxID=192944 RepID=UPI00163A1576|nr:MULTISPECIES: hypothetical protein [unclassified Rhodococcus (in: high G+C Gram-positive bacteria)]MBC2644330.1 hypothetical protein [Rhodococcus sp. 3A]MBC2897977.1 hypothetical protein [Rhodococcus sp. 4CII]